MMINPTVVFPGPNVVVMEDRPIPQPSPDQLLIDTQYTMISTGTELTVLKGEFVEGSRWEHYGKFPFYPGYNNIGKVVGAGAGVDPEWIGKQVATHGKHAKYVVSDTQSVRTVHRDIPAAAASFFALAEIAMNGIRRGQVVWGEAVIVYGMGLLGQLAVRFLRMCGAKPVFAVDISDQRLGKLPADVSVIPIRSDRDHLVEIVRHHTKGRMADVVFEATGVSGLIPREFEALRKLGRFVVLSSPGGLTSFDFHDLCNSPSFTIIGAHNSSHPPFESPDTPWTMKRHAELFFDLVADRGIDVEPLISHLEHYTKAAELYRMLLEHRANFMGVVLDWSLSEKGGGEKDAARSGRCH